MLESIIRHFDINSHIKPQIPTERTKGKKIHWIPQWIALLSGIFIQPYFDLFKETQKWDFSNFPSWVIFSAIVAIVVFPAVYRSVFDAEKPFIVLIAPIFTAGLGWQELFSTVVAAVGNQ